MADARVLAEVEQESENATEELTNSLLFVNAKSQFKWMARLNSLSLAMERVLCWLCGRLQVWLSIFMLNQFQRCPFPPGQPRGICLRCQSRGWGIRKFIAARGLGISVPWGDPRGIWHTCFRKMVEFIGKGVGNAFVKDWRVRQGLENLSMSLDMFSQFKIFPQYL